MFKDKDFSLPQVRTSERPGTGNYYSTTGIPRRIPSNTTSFIASSDVSQGFGNLAAHRVNQSYNYPENNGGNYNSAIDISKFRQNINAMVGKKIGNEISSNQVIPQNERNTLTNADDSGRGSRS